MSFVPIIGTAPLMIGVALWAFFYANSSVIAIVILISSFIVGLIDNFSRPLLMKGRFELGFYWIFLAIIGGILSFGLIGALIGPFVFSLFKEFFTSIQNRTINSGE